MLARLSLRPVWHPLDDQLEALDGAKTQVITPDGDAFEFVVKIEMEQPRQVGKQCCVVLTDHVDNPRSRTFLTKEALQLMESMDGAHFILDFRKREES